jgi:hypothetical protein
MRSIVRACGLGAIAAVLTASQTSCRPEDECTPSASECWVTAGSPDTVAGCVETTSEWGSYYSWRTKDVCSGGRSCLRDTAVGAICVASTTRDPMCAGTQGYCVGDTLVTCADGYRLSSGPCGTADETGTRPGGAPATRCIAGQSEATCIPPEAAKDPLCRGDTPHCDGDALVECALDYAVFRSSCGMCSLTATGWACIGFLGAFCAFDEQCAKGMTCRDTGGFKTCTAPCTVSSSGDDCLARLGTGGLPLSTYMEISPLSQGPNLACVAGYCIWQ